MYHIVSYIFEIAVNNAQVTFSLNGSDDVFCELEPGSSGNLTNITLLFNEDIPTSDEVTKIFYTLWDLQKTAPFALAFLLVPIIFIKSPTVFMKLNSLGTLSVIVLLGFVILKAWKWNFINISNDTNDLYYVPAFQWRFAVQGGILSQALFIHNCIHTVLQLQRRPENNSRDLGIAYGLVGLTYFAIALFIYLAFPLAKSCILDNFLDNFQSSDLPAFCARIFMFFQVLCLFPLFTYMLRTQLFYMIFPSNPEASFCRLFTFNGGVVIICILFAIYIPRIGTIIRFVGAVSGLVLVFTLPPIAHLKALQIHYSNNVVASGNMRQCTVRGIPITRLAFHSFLVIFGAANCISQFLIE